MRFKASKFGICGAKMAFGIVFIPVLSSYLTNTILLINSSTIAATQSQQLRSGHTERGLPQRTEVSVRCGMLHSKHTLLTIIF